MNHHTFDSIKGAGDIVAAGLTVGVVASLLPPLAALLTIVWTAIRIWETETIKKLTGRS